MKELFSSFVLAFSKYSCAPKTKIKMEKNNAGYILLFTPLVGVVIGVCLYYWGEAWPYLCNYTVLPAVMCAVLPAIISGGSHMEGFVRTVDALCAHKSREKKLEILSDSRSGYFAILLCVIYFMVLMGIWSEMPLDGVLIMALGFVLSRSLSGLSVLTLKHTQNSKCDIYVPENKTTRLVEIIILTLYSMACAYGMVMLNPDIGLICVIGAIVTFIYYWIMTYKHFGGITEDCANFFVQLCEIIVPLFALFAYKKWW